MAYNNQQKENPNNFFARNIKEKGEDFLDDPSMTSDQLQVFAINVFRDMVKGRINIPKYAQYFCDDRIITNFIISASMKYELFKTTYDGMCALVQSYINRNEAPPENIKITQNHWACCTNAYAMILQSFQMLKDTRNVGVLQTLVSNIRDKNYRYYV